MGGGSHKGGNRVYLVAKPNNGYIFAGWEGDAEGSENPLALDNLSQSVQIVARFRAISNGIQGIASVIQSATHLTNDEKRNALLQIALTGTSPLVSIGSGNNGNSQNILSPTLDDSSKKMNSEAFGPNSAQMEHAFLPWKSGWSGEVDQEGGQRLSIQTTKTEKIYGVNCLLVDSTAGNGSWKSRWFARDLKGTIWLIREIRGQRLVDIAQPFIPLHPEAGWKNWTDASAIPNEFVVIGSTTSAVRLSTGEILENCLRLIVHSSEGTLIEYYAKGRGLVKIENP